MVSDVTNAHSLSDTCVGALHGLAGPLVESDRQVIFVYLFQSVDFRRFQVRVISVQAAE